jgi:hypothetical protein
VACPFCDAEDAPSTLTPGMSSSTCISFTAGHHDESGAWVRHRDPNWHTTEYACSRGHRYEIRRHEGEPDEVRLLSTLTTTARPEARELAVDPVSAANGVVVHPPAVSSCIAPTSPPPSEDGGTGERVADRLNPTNPLRSLIADLESRLATAEGKLYDARRLLYNLHSDANFTRGGGRSCICDHCAAYRATALAALRPSPGALSDAP